MMLTKIDRIAFGKYCVENISPVYSLMVTNYYIYKCNDSYSVRASWSARCARRSTGGTHGIVTPIRRVYHGSTQRCQERRSS